MADFSIPKPIETRYKGYRFRSRLEARWAVYFDALKIEWEYEKEGYKIEAPWGETKFYLPDFWLPQVNMWAEVKPGEFEIEDEVICEELAMQTGFGCLLLEGPPDYITYRALVPYAPSGEEARKYGNSVSCRNEFYVLDTSYIYGHHEHRFYFCGGYHELLEVVGVEADDGSEIDVAIKASRSARFEYGESGYSRNR